MFGRYTQGIGVLGPRRGGAGTTSTRMILSLSPGNQLFPEDIDNVPEWFEVGENFTLSLSDGDIEFEWDTDHWEAVGDFPRNSGTGTVIQGANSTPARYRNADSTNYLTAAGSVRITAASGIYITWSGV